MERYATLMEQPPEQLKIESLAEAARLTGKSRTTIQRAIKSGKLSAPKDEHGNYCIDPAELNRVYPLKSEGARGTHSAAASGTLRNSNGTGGAPPDIRVLRAELKASQQMIEERGKTIEDLRTRLDDSDRRVTALLSDQREKASQKPSEGRKTHPGYLVALGAVIALLAVFWLMWSSGSLPVAVS